MRIHLDDVWSACRVGAPLGISALALVLLHASASLPERSLAAVPAASLTSPEQLAPRSAEFGVGIPTAAVRWLADWIADSRDNGNVAFIIVDKRAAQLHVFDADARQVASTAVLLGAALGDESVPGIGLRPMEFIRARERTTPAGRFVGERGRNAAGEDIVWVDYDAAVSMHRVRLTRKNEHERRAERLASASAVDNRISYGCINVPAAFYDRQLQPLFARHHASIYILPDKKSAQEVFGPYMAASPKGFSLLSLASGQTASDPWRAGAIDAGLGVMP